MLGIRSRFLVSFAVISTFWCTSAVRAGDTADEVLKTKGLRRSGAFYVLPGEADLNKKIGQLRASLGELSLTIARKQSLEAGTENNKKLFTTYTQQRRLLRQRLLLATSVAEHNQIAEMMDELGDRLNLLIQEGDNAKAISDVGAKVAARREAYVQALLDTRGLVDATNKSYAELAQDEAVKKALAEINKEKKSPIKLGPTRAYQTNVKLFEKLESSLLTETIPMREQGGVFYVDTVLNGKLSKPMIFDTGASLVSLPPDLANQLGLKPTQDTPTIKLQTADGTIVEGKLMTLDSVRVGKFQVENVQCAVLPEKLSNAPPLLGATFHGNFAYKVNPEAGKLTLSKVTTSGPEKPARQAAKKKK